MFKKLIVALLIALPFTMSAQKFGVVDAQSVIEALPGFADMKSKLETASKSYEEDLARMQKEMETKYTEFQQMAKDTPEQIMERRMQELQELDQKINQFRSQAAQDLQRQQVQLLQPLQEQVINAIKTVGQEGAFTFIFENTMPLYTGTSAEDVTPQVRKLLGL